MPDTKRVGNAMDLGEHIKKKVLQIRGVDCYNEWGNGGKNLSYPGIRNSSTISFSKP